MASAVRHAFILLVVVFIVYDAVESRGLRSDYKTHSLFRQHLLKQRGLISKVRSLFGRHSETTHKPEPPVAQDTPGNDIVPETDKPSEEKPGDSDETPEGENAATEKPEENDDTPENTPEGDNAATERPEENGDTPENTPSIDVEVNIPGDNVVVVVESTKPPCDEELFTCGNGECALQSWRCDGDDDCGDGSDEVGCDSRTCPPRTFECDNHNCINHNYICDGGDDCGDGSDERNCYEPRTCPPRTFECDNHNCINSNFICDGDNDCGDGSDERNCTGPRTCPPGAFECDNHNCINPNYICDHDDDCGDGSDEQNCTNSDDYDYGSGPGSDPCPRSFFGFGRNPVQCLHPVLYALHWQAAADFCRALHPKAHLQVIDTPAQFSDMQELFRYPSRDRMMTQSCPKWWTAGRRVDDSVADSPFVWDICSGRSSTQDENCLSTCNLNSYWPSRGGSDFAEGQPACVAFSIGTIQLPWGEVSCESHACSMCAFTL